MSINPPTITPRSTKGATLIVGDKPSKEMAYKQSEKPCFSVIKLEVC